MNKVEVRLRLLPKQRVADNKWKCTINGEERLVTCDDVVFHADSLDNVSRRFDQSECLDVRIAWRREYGLSATGTLEVYD